MTLFVFLFVPHLFFRFWDNKDIITVTDEICCAIGMRYTFIPNHVGIGVFLMEKEFISLARRVGYIMYIEWENLCFSFEMFFDKYTVDTAITAIIYACTFLTLGTFIQRVEKKQIMICLELAFLLYFKVPARLQWTHHW